MRSIRLEEHSAHTEHSYRSTPEPIVRISVRYFGVAMHLHHPSPHPLAYPSENILRITPCRIKEDKKEGRIGGEITPPILHHSFSSLLSITTEEKY